jgi:hypothetical protein
LSSYLDFIKNPSVSITWNNEVKECFTDIKEEQIDVSYPCLKFLKARLELAEEYEVGVYAWEAGQGLEYFYELF